MKVALQPASLAGREVRKHFEDTIETLVVFADHADLLDPGVHSELDRLFPAGAAAMWGVLPGKANVNVGRVARLAPGDFVLFYGEKRFYLAGTIALLWHNNELAQRLWTDNGETPPQTWEYMYALTDVRRINVPIEEVRPLIGWTSPTSYLMGFTVYDQDEAERLSDLCNLEASDLLLEQQTLIPPVPGRGRRRSGAFSGPTDSTAVVTRRREQASLKARLVELGANSCALCGLELPSPFLIGAHIKRRSQCTETERADFDNVAMLACLLGCDSLYEHGYIAVDNDGKILVSPYALDEPAVSQHVESRLVGRSCPWWSPSREQYFSWHRDHTSSGPYRTGAPRSSVSCSA